MFVNNFQILTKLSKFSSYNSDLQSKNDGSATVGTLSVHKQSAHSAAQSPAAHSSVLAHVWSPAAVNASTSGDSNPARQLHWYVPMKFSHSEVIIKSASVDRLSHVCVPLPHSLISWHVWRPVSARLSASNPLWHVQLKSAPST